MKQTWTFYENQLVLELFNTIGGDVHSKHMSDIHDVSEMVGKKVGSVKMKLDNFMWLETNGLKGLSGYTKDCETVWLQQWL